jgi:hypothetical protein
MLLQLAQIKHDSHIVAGQTSAQSVEYRESKIANQEADAMMQCVTLESML